MKKKVIKELQKLMALCMEINEKTGHEVFIHYFPHVKHSLEIEVYENGWQEGKKQIDITGPFGYELNLPNINKCCQKLLKYKEW